LDEGPFIEAFSAWVRDHVATHVPFVAEVDGDAVGMAWLMVADRVPNSDPQRRRFGDIQSVYVVPELRDRRIGAALLAAVLAVARGLELEHVTVHSSDRGAALSAFGVPARATLAPLVARVARRMIALRAPVVCGG